MVKTVTENETNTTQALLVLKSAVASADVADAAAYLHSNMSSISGRLFLSL